MRNLGAIHEHAGRRHSAGFASSVWRVATNYAAGRRPLAQMRTDLDRMDSLLGNMSSEIEFLRDQNLQILLRTNAQMWTILIRDLRKQVDREEQQRNRGQQPEGGSPAPKPR
jgi:hypothetical protein